MSSCNTRLVNPAEDSPARVADAMRESRYIADLDLATVLHLARVLQRPLLLEGEAGVGKTEVAKCAATVFGAELVRLQCYEGLDAQHALYDWDYRRQLLAIQMAKAADSPGAAETDALYTEQYLVRRPVLQAIGSDTPSVLLIDEIDRADEGFEALLLEVLSDFQVTVPELGTVNATHKPLVILTSNGVRELSDALRRRCLYHHLDYPDRDKERAILAAHLPALDQTLGDAVVDLVQSLRSRPMRKTPGIAETLDWAASLLQLDIRSLEPDTVDATLGALIKTREDRAALEREEGGLARLLAGGTSPDPAQ